jgi:glutamate-ammonia-ligase adenylyltransferase
LRSNLAGAALSEMLPLVMARHEQKYGRVRRGAFAVVALGKAGGGEMLAGSDLDLMLIYDHAPMPAAPTQYFVRLAHALTAALTAQGREGPLYKVDMRLRPSGNQGPVAVSLAAFRRYHATESWTWERLALTRARVLAATPGFAVKLRREIVAALCRPDEAAKIRGDTVAMRDRIAQELPPRGPFDVKTLPGGMLEVAFIAEALQLIHGPAAPALFRANTRAALRGLEAAGYLPEADAAALVAADFLWRSIQGIDRLTGLRETATEPPVAMLAPLLRATATAELGALRRAMGEASRAVRACFEKYIGKPSLF